MMSLAICISPPLSLGPNCIRIGAVVFPFLLCHGFSFLPQMSISAMYGGTDASRSTERAPA
jgi:hypothetical protein